MRTANVYLELPKVGNDIVSATMVGLETAGVALVTMHLSKYSLIL